MADESNQFTDVTTNSWGGRLASSFTGIIFGLIFFVVAFPLLWWNEGRSVERTRTLDEGRNMVMAVDVGHIDPANNEKLIYVTGKATTNDTVSDSVFGVQENALKLKRTVKMYQWEEKKSTETEHNAGGSTTTQTTYSYDKVWSDKLIHSSDFHHMHGHENPTSMPYQSQTFTAPDIELGAFRLTDRFTSQINNYEDYPLQDRNYAAMDKRLQSSFPLSGTEYFYGDPANPVIGAMRVHFSIIHPSDASVVGKQSASTIEPYYTRHGDLSLLEMKTAGPDELFADAEDQNMLLTWGLRLAGFFIMWIGLAMILAPLKVLGDVIPLIGSIIGAGVGGITGIIALALSFIVIASAWIAFRPLVGIPLLVLACIVAFGGKTLIAKAEAELALKRSPAAPQP